jgi:hypothetical protein
MSTQVEYDTTETVTPTTEMEPWLDEELPPQSKKTSLVDDLADLFRKLWDEDVANFRKMATSTDRESSAEGSVRMDKDILAWLLKQAAGEGTRVGDADAADIAYVVHHAQARFGRSRTQITARKAELALTQGGVV